MRIETVMTPVVAAVRADNTLRYAASLMRSTGVGSLVIFEDDRLAGILTEHDLVAPMADGRSGSRVRVGEVMSRDVAVARPDEDSQEVAVRMVERGVRHLPVVDRGRVVGMVSARDLLVVEAVPRAGHAVSAR